MHIKDVRVTNPGNVLVQIPGFVTNKWKLLKGSELEVHISDDGQTVIIRPKALCIRGSTD